MPIVTSFRAETTLSVQTRMITDNPLKHFAKPKAKIDFITLRILNNLDKKSGAALAENVKGRIEVPRQHWKSWLTIHDPKIKDLQYLLDHHPDCEIQGLEVAIDFRLADDSNDRMKLITLHSWLKKRLFPQRDQRMQRVSRRKYYDLHLGKIVKDTLKTRSGVQSVYWTNNNGFEQMRLYIKTRDNGQPLAQHSVRVETTLSRGGCQNAHVSHVSTLPNFAKVIRTELSKLFYIAAGIKPSIKRLRSTTPQKAALAAKQAEKEKNRVNRTWERMGAAWAAEHDYKTVPDTQVNRLIGVALKGLREEMLTLKLTRKVAELPSYETLKAPK